MTPPRDQELEELLLYLKFNRGFDFTAYKRATLARRVAKRVQAVGLQTPGQYEDYLEVHPDEFAHLFNTILINVTGFFRDTPAWDVIASQAIPRVLESKRQHEPVRVWCAGCSSGEEAYTIVMLLAERLGSADFVERVKIYATDLDEESLVQARQAAYTRSQVEEIPEALRSRYFEEAGDKYLFDKDLRRCVIFGRHDLLQDAPISKVDLLTCRNTLMYFNAEAQNRILGRFHFALNDDGYLLLGKAETLISQISQNLFTVVDLKNRIFAKTPSRRNNGRLWGGAPAPYNGIPNGHAAAFRLLESALDSSPVAQIVVDQGGVLALANERARSLFGLGANDIGRPLQDLELSYRPVELRSCIEQASIDRRTVLRPDVHWEISATNAVDLDVQVVPVFDSTGSLLCACINLIDITRARKLHDQLQQLNQELETAYEELQSANEEMETINTELQGRVHEQSETNAFLASILGSLQDAVIVVNGEFVVLAWNPEAEDLWGLREDEAKAKYLLNLDIGLPTEKLMAPMRACLSSNDRQEIELEATNRRGKPILCRVTCTPLRGRPGDARGVILLVSERSMQQESHARNLNTAGDS